MTDEQDARERDHPLWRSDHIRLRTVGIDIGSATSQVVFSAVRLRRLSRDLSSRYAVVARDTWHRGRVHLTPYRIDGDIDGDALARLIADSYTAAGAEPDEVDTGVVILTGEAAHRRNARTVADVLATAGGRFVSVAAGHHLEGVLAAHGSGAVADSRRTGRTILNVDIGGGTTKLTVVAAGVVAATAALHLGGRLLALDPRGRIMRLEEAGRRIALACGFDWQIGDATRDAAGDRLADLGRWMADRLLAAVKPGPVAPSGPGDLAALWLTEPLVVPQRLDAVMMSGGVSEYVYGHPAFRGDLGAAFGGALRDRLADLPAPLAPAHARIRATVLGAAEYSVQVSGNTIHVSPPSALPLRNLRVVRPRLDLSDPIDADALAAAIREHLLTHDVVEGDADLALALDWSGAPSYARLAALAQGIRRAARRTLSAGHALCVVFDHDVAHLVGRHLDELLAAPDAGASPGPVVVLDGVALSDLDFIDIGAVMPDSGAASVTVKSLLFGL